ncbi:hypothetical protein NHX12_003196 [Muraenolepis orangiensis]|uniref:Mucosa-associated lymphoid tissue lymphoma translocation protein 1 n=1 Tax=Muraenolepis orangiensis TaxID=630683 RepID=A0A9Q0DYB1_9TELE|nr:hypothetical protein NHX12_003196 [Muraenolepis orangiensis]
MFTVSRNREDNAVITANKSELLRTMIQDIAIVRHPVSVCVPVNHEVVLSVRAEGTGVLNYQWFTDHEQEVFGGTREDLRVKAQQNQLFVCRVNDQFRNCVFSEWVRVKVLDIPKPGMPRVWQGELHIVLNPKSQTVQEGQKLTLRCAAFGTPDPHYQWYRNGLPLQDNNSETLQVERTTADHGGTYLCSVSNVLEERWSTPADIEIVTADELPPPTLTATDKVALLIGNLNYVHHPLLMAPTMDVHQLGNLLQQLGFRVVSLIDLTREEMMAAIDKFLDLLDRGVYGLFYYAGHGYERSGRNYLVAVDAPQPYQPENCVCVQRIMLKMQNRQTALSVILLDTCRKWYNRNCVLSEIMPLGPRGNTVYGYATCEDAEAFEVQDGGKSTGIFTKYLNKHILKKGKVTHVLEQVSEDLGRDPLVTGKQAMEIKHTLKEPRSLTDRIRTTGHTRELHLRDTCWRRANALPGKERLKFRCGVVVEVSFSALFSNTLVVFGTVKTTGPKAQACSVILSSTPSMVDIFSGPGRSEVDSLIHIKSDNPDGILRLCSLQKLQGSLVINVDLHYTHVDSKLRLKESQQKDIGRPLVASWELYMKQGAGAAKVHDAVPARSFDGISKSKSPIQQTVDGQCRPFTRKAEVLAARSKEPEENDENEHWN